jgi:uncharacterized Zn finger protein
VALATTGISVLVAVGGKGVNVIWGVDVTGWKGVGVCVALGSAVTSRKDWPDGAFAAAMGRENEATLHPIVVESKTKRKRMRLAIGSINFRLVYWLTSLSLLV